MRALPIAALAFRRPLIIAHPHRRAGRDGGRDPQALTSAGANKASGWAQSTLYQLADADLTSRADRLSLASPWTLCRAGLDADMSGSDALDAGDSESLVISTVAAKVPCRGTGGGEQCCPHAVHFRRNTTDFKVFEQVRP